MAHPVALGVAAGLVLGKQLGVTLFAWLAARTGLAALPPGVTWRHIYGAAWLAGIGFTMSLFIANLAFDEAALLAPAKVGILAASLVSGGVGWLLLRRLPLQPAGAEREWPERPGAGREREWPERPGRLRPEASRLSRDAAHGQPKEP